MFQNPAHSRVSDTTPSSDHQQLSMPRSEFDRALALVLRFEGGISRDQRDPANAGGRATNRGITQKTYDAWRDEQRLARQSVLAMPDNELRQIYFEHYWQRGSCERLGSVIGIAHMDACVNLGVAKATKILQSALRELKQDQVVVDGHIGPVTLSAVAVVNQAELLACMLENREEHYRQLAEKPNFAPFLKGWLSRVNQLREALSN